MKIAIVGLASILLASGVAVAQEEKPVPKDSERISVPGCARGRSFIVSEPLEHEPVRSDIEPGRRFRLNGPKKIMDEIKAREGYQVEVTGLVRKSQVEQRGIPIAGGRIRIGGGMPRDPIYSDPRRDPLYNEVVMDVESFRALGEACPKR